MVSLLVIRQSLEKNNNLKSICNYKFNRLVLVCLNIHSVRNKSDNLTQKITDNVVILMIWETELDNSFPEGQFLIPGYRAPYRIDQNCHGGNVMVL